MVRDNIRIEPRVRLLTQILDLIDTGNLRVPKFQRPFVWTPSKMLALFDSIYRGYPIGSLLFWNTNKEYSSLPNIGLHKLRKDTDGVYNYILDGHQRLSTLYGILKKTKEEVSDKSKKKWLLFFDLEEERFLFYPTNGKIPLNWFPMDSIIDTFDFLKASRNIERNFPEKADEYIKKAEDLAKTILNYQLAITQIEGGKIESAVEIFSRLNTTGQNMSIAQMLTALTYSDNFHLTTEIEKIKQDLEDVYFSEIDSDIILRIIITASGREVYNYDIQNLKKANWTVIISDSKKGMIKAANFFYNDLNIPGNHFLPYSLQFVLFSEFFRLCPNPTKFQLEALKKYFWITSFTGWFRSNSFSKTREALSFTRDLAKKININSTIELNYLFGSSLPLPEVFYFRNARIKTYLLFLLNSNRTEDKLNEIKHLLGKYGSKSVYKIINRKDLEFDNKDIQLNTPENILASIDRKTILENNDFSNKDSLIYNVTFLKDNLLTIEMINLLKNGKHEEFLNKRRFYLIDNERKFMMKNGVRFSTP